MAAVTGMLSRLQINSQIYNFGPSTIGAASVPVDTNLMRGILSHDVGRFRDGVIRCGGQMRFEPNVVEMPLLNTWAMGGASSTLADTALVYGVIADKKADVYNYASVCVNRCTWSASQGEPLGMSLDVVGINEAGGASWGSPTALNDATGPWMFQEMVFTIGGSPFKSRSFSLVLDNHVDTGRYFNSRTLASLVWQDKTVTLNLDLPFGDSVALYNTGSAGLAMVGTFTNAATSDILRFTMGHVVFGQTPPVISGRSEVMMTISGMAASTGSTRELLVTYV